MAVHFTRNRGAEIGESLSAATPGGAPAPAGVSERLEALVGQAAFTDGATQAFLVGAFMIWTASAIVWVVLNVKHHELVDDETPEGVVV